MTSTHKCAHPACDAQVGMGRLTCPPHWYELPSAIRDRINRHWRQLGQGIASALPHYHSAVNDAMSYFSSSTPSDHA